VSRTRAAAAGAAGAVHIGLNADNKQRYDNIVGRDTAPVRGRD